MDALICPGCSRRLRPTRAAQEVRCPLCATVFTPAAPPRPAGGPKQVPDAAFPVPALVRPWYWNRWVKVGLFLLAWGVAVAVMHWAIRRGGMDDQPTPDPASLKVAKNHVVAALNEAMAGKSITTPTSADGARAA